VRRLLFLTESFYPILGGGERHIQGLAEALAGQGFSCTVLTRRSSEDLAMTELLGQVRVVRVPPAGPARTGKYLMIAPALLGLARERASYDVVVVRGTRLLGLPGLLAARALGKKVVLQPELNGEFTGDVYTYGTALDGGLPRALVHLGTRARNVLLLDADRVVAMSRAIRDEAVHEGVAEERVALIPHGVDTDRFRPWEGDRGPQRMRLGIPEASLVVAYSGRLLRGKGLEVLLEAFARVAAREPAAHLLLLGSGEGQALSVEASLRAAAEAPGLSGRVTFAGRREDVADCLGAADVFAFPSLYEALGIALIEAQACGLPAVGSRTGGIVDVIEDGKTGLLVPPGDAAALAEALLALVRERPRRVALGRSARERAAARFSSRASTDAYRELFLELGSSSG
jgi:glycosyltransferase involved in cell wall biosynthesis